ncbi:MAG TPA: hypothetical protein VL551_33685 [Actinospica sp.]|jgi:hypothetical protein|nr:hypothetical protein [Actinospica sp.]
MLKRFPPRDPAQLEHARKAAATVLADWPGAHAFLCGSSFAGLGTPASDVDLYVITAEGGRTRQIDVDGVRVDVEQRSREWLERLVENCREFTVTPADASQLGYWSYERLDEAVRFALGEIVADDGSLAALQSRINDSADPLTSLIVAQHGMSNSNRAEDIWGALAVGDETAAQSLARTMLTSTAEALLAARGDAYIGLKWVWTQWARTIGQDLGEDVTRVLHDPAASTARCSWLSQDFLVMAITGLTYPVVTADSPSGPQRDMRVLPFLTSQSVLLNRPDSRAVKVSRPGALLWGVAHGRPRDAAVAMAGELLGVRTEDVDRYYDQLVKANVLSEGTP